MKINKCLPFTLHPQDPVVHWNSQPRPLASPGATQPAASPRVSSLCCRACGVQEKDLPRLVQLVEAVVKAYAKITKLSAAVLHSKEITRVVVVGGGMRSREKYKFSFFSFCRLSILPAPPYPISFRRSLHICRHLKKAKLSMFHKEKCTNSIPYSLVMRHHYG